MLDNEQQMLDLDRRLRDASEEVVKYAKGLVPVLRDAGREHSAKELERMLLAYDVAVDECGQFLKANIGDMLRRLGEGK